MTHKYINELLELNGESPVLLEDCVLNIRDGRSIIYTLFDEHLEICYADKHTDVIWEGNGTDEEFEEIILKNLK